MHTSCMNQPLDIIMSKKRKSTSLTSRSSSDYHSTSNIIASKRVKPTPSISTHYSLNTGFPKMGSIVNDLLDFVYSKVLSDESLRQKRRSIQISTLEYSIDPIIAKEISSGKEVKNLSGDEMKQFFKEVLDGKCQTPSIVGMITTKKSLGDTDDKDSDPSPQLVLKQETDGAETSSIIYAPLLEAGSVLTKLFEQQLTSTALCFIADASSGLGTKMLGKIVSSCGAGMALIEEPVWMTALANLVEQKEVSGKNLEQVMFGLCRLNAWQERDQVGESRTAVFTLPGQSCTANLLPVLQKMFPCERHVFVYDSCTDSVSRSLRNSELSSSIPISNNIDKTITPKKLNPILAKLSSSKAGAVEAWLSSADTFLKLKHSERKSGYIPFVCRLGFLMGQFGQLGNGQDDKSELALINILQYMTGSRSRQLKDSVINAAKETLDQVRIEELEMLEKYKGNLSKGDRDVMEECAFAHKGILIQNKTLMDTVQPNKEWSLKAAKKMTSCACCMPGEGGESDDEEEDENEIANSKNDAKPQEVLKTTFNAMPSSTYVDGKVAFAFDPSKFTGM